MKTTAYDVATKVIVDQAFTTLRELRVEGTAARRQALADVGLHATAFIQALEILADSLAEAEAAQERAKTAYLREAKEDQARAEQGYRYKLALDARIRAYLATHEDEDSLRARFRFGKLRAARARGVTYELRIVLPEAAALEAKLSVVGINAAFVERGYSLLAGLDADREESAAAKDERKQATKAVQELELAVSQQLAHLMAADEAVALERPQEGAIFALNVIRTEEARLSSARTSRVIATSAPDANPPAANPE